MPVPPRSSVSLPIKSFLNMSSSDTLDAVNALINDINRYVVTVPPLVSLYPADTSSIIADVFHVSATFSAAVSSQAIFPAIYGQVTYPAGAPALTGGAHIIGTLGRVFNYNTAQTLGLAIGAEGKIDNNAAGTITNAFSLTGNLGANAGTITSWYGSYSNLAANAGTISTAVGYGLDVGGNVGTITSYYGFFFPTLTSQNITTTIIGFFFANNPSTTALKLAFYCADPAAQINTAGPIVSAGQTTTATLQLDTGTKTATASAGAATLNKASGVITSESLVTAAGAAYTLTLTDSQIAAADVVVASVANGTNNAGIPVLGRVTPAAGSVTIEVRNVHASAAFNGTIVISFISSKN